MIKIVNGKRIEMTPQEEAEFQASRQPTVEELRRKKFAGLETDYRFKVDTHYFTYLTLKKTESYHGGPALTSQEQTLLDRLKANYEYYIVTKEALRTAPDPNTVSTKGWPA